MLLRILIILLLLPTIFKAQINTGCGNKLSAANLQKHYARMQSLPSILPHDTCLNRELSVVFHIVLDSSNKTGINLADLDACISKLNVAWKPLCVTFKKCSLNYIPNYNYNQWKDVADEQTCVKNYCVSNTINIFLVEKIITPAGAAGYAGKMNPNSCNKIVMDKANFNSVVAIHEMGHFFGLPHTFEGPTLTSLSTELVKRTNCYSSGDGFCDTEADPYPTGKTTGAHCDFQPGSKDANGNYYTPPLDNYMTYFAPCVCRFTQEQYNFMALTFLLDGTSLH
jgi:hypothetical protein